MFKKKLLIRFCVFCLIVIIFIAAGLYKSEQIIISKQVFTGLSSLQETKILLISDLHSHVFDEDNQMLIDMIHAQNPELILILGDFINEVQKMKQDCFIL